MLTGRALRRELRKAVDSAVSRLWIAVPAIGSWHHRVRSQLGMRWRKLPDIRLLTDIDALRYDEHTLGFFFQRGQIRSLRGLHAKVYIADEWVLLTSANLSGFPSSPHYEMGVVLGTAQAAAAVRLFEDWWELPETRILREDQLPGTRNAYLTRPTSTVRMKAQFNGIGATELWNLRSRLNRAELVYGDVFRARVDPLSNQVVGVERPAKGLAEITYIGESGQMLAQLTREITGPIDVGDVLEVYWSDSDGKKKHRAPGLIHDLWETLEVVLPTISLNSPAITDEPSAVVDRYSFVRGEGRLGDYIDLAADGKVTIRRNGTNSAGTFQVSDDKLTLVAGNQRPFEILTLVSNTLIDSHGSVWENFRPGRLKPAAPWADVWR